MTDPQGSHYYLGELRAETLKEWLGAMQTELVRRDVCIHVYRYYIYEKKEPTISTFNTWYSRCNVYIMNLQVFYSRLSSLRSVKLYRC